MDIGSIGAASIEMSLARTQGAAGVSLMKGAMESHEAQAAQLIQAITESVPPPATLLDAWA